MKRFMNKKFLLIALCILVAFSGGLMLGIHRGSNLDTRANTQVEYMMLELSENFTVVFGGKSVNNPSEYLTVKWQDRGAMPSSYYVIDYRWHPYPLIIPLCKTNIEKYNLPLDYILEQIAEMYKKGK